MDKILEFLLHDGYSLLIAWVLAEQVGLPPSEPALVACGAMAGTRRMYLPIVVAIPVPVAAICEREPTYEA